MAGVRLGVPALPFFSPNRVQSPCWLYSTPANLYCKGNILLAPAKKSSCGATVTEGNNVEQNQYSSMQHGGSYI